MRGELADQVAAAAYATVDFAVIIAPALALRLAAERGGMGDTHGVDLLIASAVLGAAHAAVAWSRLRFEERTAVRRADMWIAAVDALVVLALGATVLLVAVLYGFSDEHASLAHRGYPVVALWVGLQLTAIAAAEVTGRVVFWWLEPHPSRVMRRRTLSPSPPEAQQREA